MVKEELNRVLEPAVAGLGFEYVGCEFITQGRGALLRVYIERSEAEQKQGVNIDDCAAVSRQISAVLDVEDLIHGHYRLEVSSPGMERPLFTIEHFQRFVNHKAHVKLHNPIDGRRNFSGIIQAVDAGKVVLIVDEQEFTLEMANIDKANLVYDFE